MGKLLKSKMFIFSISLVLISGLASCSEEDLKVTPEGNEDLNSESSEKVSNSIITLPASISQQQGGSKLSKATRSGGGGGDDMLGIFSGIRHYVGMAEDMKDMVKEFMGHMIGSNLLKFAPIGEEIDIPEDETDPEAPRKVRIDKPNAEEAGEEYVWKISLYFEEDATTPEMIIRFTLTETGAKGRILWEMTREHESVSSLNITSSVDVTFDGTDTIKTLETKLTQDLSELVSYAYTEGLTETEIKALDLGQPSKVFVMAQYDGTEFTIYGTSYHPTWIDESILKGEDMPWNDSNRTMYMFKAKAIEGDNEGAKVYLSIPENDLTDISTVWTNHSIGVLFTDMMVGQVNDMLVKLADGTDDIEEEGPAKTIPEEQQEAVNIMAFVLGVEPSLPTLAEHVGGESFSSDEYDAAAAYYAGTIVDTMLFQNVSLDTVEEFNAWFATLPATTENEDDPSKESMYNLMMAPEAAASIAAQVETRGYSLTKAEIEAFIYDESVSSGAEEFKAGYDSIKYIINPAFFDETSGFLGTYDEANDEFYNYSNTGMTAGAKPAKFDALDALDLDSIDPYVPSEVVSATITVE